MSFKRLDPTQLHHMRQQQTVTVLDIRDPRSFDEAHIEGALHVEDIQIETFVEAQPKTEALVICCYHGISSQSAAAYFAEKGFTDVYSLDGGYEGWRGMFPDQ